MRLRIWTIVLVVFLCCGGLMTVGGEEQAEAPDRQEVAAAVEVDAEAPPMDPFVSTTPFVTVKEVQRVQCSDNPFCGFNGQDCSFAGLSCTCLGQIGGGLVCSPD